MEGFDLERAFGADPGEEFCAEDFELGLFVRIV